MSGHRWHRGRRAGHLETSAHGSACRSLASARQNLRAAAQWQSSSCHPWKSVPAGWLNNVAQSPAFASPQLLTRRDRDNPAAPFPVDGGIAALESACIDTGTCPPLKAWVDTHHRKHAAGKYYHHRRQSRRTHSLLRTWPFIIASLIHRSSSSICTISGLRCAFCTLLSHRSLVYAHLNTDSLHDEAPRHQAALRHVPECVPDLLGASLALRALVASISNTSEVSLTAGSSASAMPSAGGGDGVKALGYGPGLACAADPGPDDGDHAPDLESVAPLNRPRSMDGSLAGNVVVVVVVPVMWW
ncbi:hypothetical protein ACCO45_004297 [Purpureocillium lilacinum]|uniref:Uncharacterized protein n=1 Tax=Purpureocillium lilacinum TaxID=33203 RepID=A0ACC4E4U7_PURLI